jgi:ATP-binding cassette subfamily B protein
VKLKDGKHFILDLYKAALLIVKASPYTAAGNFVLLLLQSMLPVASLYFMKLLIELVMQRNTIQFNQVLPVIIGFCSVQLLTSFTTQFSNYMNTIQQQKVSDHLTVLVIEKAASVRYEYYEDPKYHDTLHLAQQQSQFKTISLLNNLNSLLFNGLSLVFLAGLFFSIQWYYALLFVGLALPISIIKWYYSNRLFNLEKKTASLEREASYLHLTLTGISYAKEARLLGYTNAFIQKFRNIRKIIFDSKRKLQSKLTWHSLLADTFEMVIVTFIFFALAKSALEKTITAGVFVIYLQGFQRLQSSAKSILQSLVQLAQQRLFVRDLFGFLSLPSSNEDWATASISKQPEALSIEHVSFIYPGTTREVLKDISLECKRGKIIAIVGENGCGKSTLVKLLGRLYDVEKGKIKIDSVPIQHINAAEFQSTTSFLFQDFEKFFFTVEENIALGVDKKNDGSMANAASLSGAAPFISGLADNYKTRLGRTFMQSEQLSGGQWQKLSLARVFYKNAPIIILDEPTSSIDALAEYELFSNLKEFSKDKIVVLISHRLYNIKIADHIYVMVEGNIVEEGSFAQLVEQNGLFSRMYAKQKLD